MVWSRHRQQVTLLARSNPSDVLLRPPPSQTSVDKYWRSQTGLIPRGRDLRFCKHGDKGMCEYCTPLEVRAQNGPIFREFVLIGLCRFGLSSFAAIRCRLPR